VGHILRYQLLWETFIKNSISWEDRYENMNSFQVFIHPTICRLEVSSVEEAQKSYCATVKTLLSVVAKQNISDVVFSLYLLIKIVRSVHTKKE
jgi:hypothetical protein